MADILVANFEGAANDEFSDAVGGGGGAIDTVVFREGAQSLYIDTVAAVKYHQHTFSAERILVGRFYYRLKTDTSGVTHLFQCYGASGDDLKIQQRVGSQLRVSIGTTNSVNSGTLNLNQWYLIDFKFDATASPWTVVWKIDGVDQTGTSKAQAGIDQIQVRFGVGFAATTQYNVDALKVTDVAADYPLGGLPVRRFARYPQLLAH